jgi:tyrosine-protein phosphatase YwqE
MWFLNKNKHPEFSDFSSVAVDMHSHLIPGIDDGCKDMQESIDLITKLYHLGYKKLITTPHVIADSFNNSPVTIKDGLNRLITAVKNTGIPIEIEAAGEYHIDDKL